jgi:hypothetical protein
MAQHPLIGQGIILTEASRLHSDTPQSVGILWTSDQPYATLIPLPDNKQHSQEKEVHATGGIRTRSPNKRAAADQLGGHCYYSPNKCRRVICTQCYKTCSREKTYTAGMGTVIGSLQGLIFFS